MVQAAKGRVIHSLFKNRQLEFNLSIQALAAKAEFAFAAGIHESREEIRVG